MSVSERQLRNLKRLLWLYFWLLIFEGALRKWFLPQLSAPLLIVRDPVVILIYAMAVSRGIFPQNIFVFGIGILAMFGFLASLVGIGTLKVTLYGVHADFLHLPLIYLIPKIFDYEDVKKVGKYLLILSVPMAVLVLMQFRAPGDAWINAAAGGEVNGQLEAAFGKIRPPGVFSFVTGMVSFTTLVATFQAWQFADHKIYPFKLICVSMGAIAVSLMVSGSRSAVVSVVIVIVALVLVGMWRGVASLSYLKYAALFFVAFLILSRIPVFHEGLAVQQERFEGAGGIHEGLVTRFFDELVNSFDACATTPILGLGLGLGTNAGAGMVSGTRQFLLSEGEWGRVISESGAVLGLAYIALRFGILFDLIGVSLKSLRRGNSLPMLLLGATGLDLVTGQFGQPTELGFVVFTCGLCLVTRVKNDPAPMPDDGPKPTLPENKKIPGRSAYAEGLYGESPKGEA